MAKPKASEKEVTQVEVTTSKQDKIRELAYLKWMAATNGQSLPEDPSGLKFWFEAETEVEESEFGSNL